MKSGRDILHDQMKHGQDLARQQQQQDQARRQQAQLQSQQHQQQMIQQQQQQMQRGWEEGRRQRERMGKETHGRGEASLPHDSSLHAKDAPERHRLIVSHAAPREGHPFLAILLVLGVLALLAFGTLTSLVFTLPGMIGAFVLLVVTLVIATRLWKG